MQHLHYVLCYRGRILYQETFFAKYSCQDNKWKNHFSEMKGDVGMSPPETKGNKRMPTPKQKLWEAINCACSIFI